MELYHLTENCEYGVLTNEMIRDRLVVGIRDEALSERLQLDPDLTLEKTKKMVPQREVVHEQQLVFKDEPTTTLDEMRAKVRDIPSESIPRCGRGQHPWEKCPARDAWCHRRKRKVTSWVSAVQRL